MYNEVERLLNDIFIAANRITLSKKEAARVVGGEKHLDELIADGCIRMTDMSKATSWRLNASDVFRHCKHY